MALSLVSPTAVSAFSSLPSHQADMQRAAEWTAERLQRAGLQDVVILPTAGHPVVYGEWLGAGPQEATILVYGHYDVQPALDISVWQSPPFEPEQWGDYLFARGVSDMKGQAMAAIAVVEAHLQTDGALPVNVKFLIEGEEEIASRNPSDFIGRERGRLACDYSLNNDSGMLSPEEPEIN